ncbi:glycoside hydrolase family 18 protein [Suillus subalutaceus]|uniref:glycoside hydrolase family 18 protein n=1 Tax=Suillus subalutaceus TaxID=48586 RepID=UPI001B87DE2C|nr:glycoside hydrolase family 18 protein [Suillus subalutaceus]KAG1862561.1 glycoside hydrolase family 18 protein [Suillus subalutaceus]
MSSTTSYQAVPSDEGSPPAKPASRFISRKTIFLSGLVFIILAFASYKAFFSIQHPSPQPDSGTKALESQTSSSIPPAPSDTLEMQGQGKGIYGRKFQPSNIPAQDLTHILYAFADLRPDSGEVVLSDAWADKDIHYPGDSWNDVGNNLYGNFKAIYKLKQQNRHLKVLLSIGGWTYSPKFHPIVVNPALRANFVRSAVRLLEDYGLDGLDVDYEYPSNEYQARGYADLLRELRIALDQHAQMKGIYHRFLLTIAAPCGPDKYQHTLDFWNMMAYDFSGSWDSVANHQANIYGGPISASQAIAWYTANGVPRSKMVLGIPLYGRSFMNTSGPGAPFSGIGPGSWEQGVYDYRALPLPGTYVFQDDKALASWSHDYQKQEMVSFDNEQVGHWKGDWIRREGLRGSMFWELSGDKGSAREGMEGGWGKDPVPGRSLIATVKNAMGPLDLSPNWLSYEGSQFDNLRSGTI